MGVKLVYCYKKQVIDMMNRTEMTIMVKKCLESSPMGKFVFKRNSQAEAFGYSTHPVSISRTFTSHDHHVAGKLLLAKKGEKIEFNDTNVMWASFDNKTLLQLIHNDYSKLTKVQDYLAQELLKDESIVSQSKINLGDQRRISLVMHVRAFCHVYNHKKNELRAITLIEQLSRNASYRDLLL